MKQRRQRGDEDDRRWKVWRALLFVNIQSPPDLLFRSRGKDMSEREESETAKAAEGTGERRAFSECGFHPNETLN